MHHAAMLNFSDHPYAMFKCWMITSLMLVMVILMLRDKRKIKKMSNADGTVNQTKFYPKLL